MSDLISRQAAEQPEKRTEERTETHACDCISREDAIDAFERFIHELGINDEPYNYGEMALSEQNVPSVEPERKTGKWMDIGIIVNTEAHVFVCSECGWHEPAFPERIGELHYCTSCGAKMEVDG